MTQAMAQLATERPLGAPLPMLLTLADVAGHLRISIRQVWRMLSDGRLYPADLSLGGKRGRRWRRERFLSWLASGCPNARAWGDTAAG